MSKATRCPHCPPSDLEERLPPHKAVCVDLRKGRKALPAPTRPSRTVTTVTAEPASRAEPLQCCQPRHEEDSEMQVKARNGTWVPMQYVD